MFNFLIDKLRALDTWSNNTIKTSAPSKAFSSIKCSVNNVVAIDKKQTNLLELVLTTLISFLFILLCLPQFSENRFGIGLYILGVSLFFLISFTLAKEVKLKFNFLDILILGISCNAIISTFSSYFFKESLLGLFKMLVFIGAYFIFKITTQNISKNNYLSIWLTILFCSWFVSIYGIYQYFIGVEPLATWSDPSIENQRVRVYSTLGNPNLLAGYLLAILPVNFILPFQFNFKTVNKLLFIIFGIITLVCIILTGSRGGLLGLVAMFLTTGIVALCYFFKTKRFNLAIPAFIFGFILILTLIFMFPNLVERFSTIFNLREHSSNNYRVNVWISSLAMLRDNFMLGIGPGNTTFRLVYGIYMRSGFEALSAYNIFLEYCIELGIFGLFLFISIFSVTFLKLHDFFWNKKNTFSIAIVLSIIAIAVHGMADTVLFRPQIFLPFWFLLATIGKLEIE